MHIAADTLDDLLREVFEKILASGVRVSTSSKGSNREIAGALLEITNPLARLSQTEMRSTAFSCLGETLWYLASSGNLDFIEYYIPHYRKYAEKDGSIWGAYGPRLFRMRQHINQLDSVIALLRKKPETRQAVIQLFDAEDILEARNDIPCTCTMQLLLRDGQLHMITNMRSNDAYLGLPHDIFAFTFLQEIIARTLDAELGNYKHVAGSLHIYDKNEDDARKYIGEAWQEKILMPPMPKGTPWPSIEQIINIEAEIRDGREVDVALLAIHDYWKDLVRLLLIYARTKKREDIGELRKQMTSRVFDIYIEKRLG